LLGAVKHFVAHRREAENRLRRGGGVAPLSLHGATDTSPGFDVADDERLSPEAVFDRQWAVTVLARAMQALQQECAAEGKEAFCETLRPWLLGESAHGDQAAAAAALGMNAGALKTAVHRMRHRFRQCVKNEVAGTLKDDTAVEDEMRALLLALSKS
jgi:RNA polymerase sigma-70 factor (ECF subfamily)